MKLSQSPAPEMANRPSEAEAKQRLIGSWRKGNHLIPQKFLGSICLMTTITDLLAQGYSFNQLQALFMESVGSEEGPSDARAIMKKAHTAYDIKHEPSDNDLTLVLLDFWERARQDLQTCCLELHESQYDGSLNFETEAEQVFLKKLHKALLAIEEVFLGTPVNNALKDYRERFRGHVHGVATEPSVEFYSVMIEHNINLEAFLVRALLQEGLRLDEAILIAARFKN